MQSATAQKRAALVSPAEHIGRAQHVLLRDFVGDVDSLSEGIARRAYESFQARGCKHGGDLADWLHAEAELFHGVHLDLEESDEALWVRSELPGFRASELKIAVEPRRLTIIGDRKKQDLPTSRKLVHRDHCPNRVYRVLGLPAEVDPTAALATLKDGILEITMPKAALAAQPLILNGATWVARPADCQAWGNPFSRRPAPGKRSEEFSSNPSNKHKPERDV
jgi:HSP20 family molecular chaperone IbpA